MFPSFEYRQWYQTDINSIEDVRKYLFNAKYPNDVFFRGMANYEFVCISTFYRHFLATRELVWSEQDVGYQSKVMLPEIDMEEYKSSALQILDVFYENLRGLGSKELSLNSIAYLAQHYGLPTDLIDFSYDPKIALYFACCEMPEHDCSVYLFDIYAHVKIMMDIYASGRVGWMQKADGSLMNSQERAELAKEYCTTISRDKSVGTVTPIIDTEDIKYGQRIHNQKGAFVYHQSYAPMDQLMYTASPETSYQGRRVFKINKALKPQILQMLDVEHGINFSFVYPAFEGNLELLQKAVEMTKSRLSL